MKKSILISATLIAFAVKAQFPTINVQGLNGEYNAPDGSGTFQDITLPESNKELKTFSVSKEESNFYIELSDGRSFHIENLPLASDDVNSMKLQRFNFNSQTSKVNLDLAFLKTITKDSKISISNFKGSCTENDTSIEDLGEKVLDACLKNSSFSLIKFHQQDSAPVFLKNILGQVLIPANTVNASSMTLSNAWLNVRNNSFNFKGKANMGMSATLKISGKSWYEKDLKRVKIRIDKAKASFLNIKGKLFQELKKNESEKLKVQNPYIYILTE